jgi:hypothetical protein
MDHRFCSAQALWALAIVETYRARRHGEIRWGNRLRLSRGVTCRLQINGSVPGDRMEYVRRTPSCDGSYEGGTAAGAEDVPRVGSGP